MSEPNLPQETPQPEPGPAAPRAVDAARAVDWLREGWQLFMKNPGVWLAIGVIALIVLLALNFVPVLGPLAANLVGPVLAAGMLGGARALARGEELRVEQLFAGFRENGGNLLMLGVAAMIGALLIGLLAAGIVGGGAMTGAMMGHGAGVGVAAGGLMLGMLVMLVAAVPFAMALWFAPALVAFRGMAAMDAIKASFGASLKNAGAFLVLLVLLVVLSFIAALPAGLGFVLLLPVLAATSYASYVDVFERA